MPSLQPLIGKATPSTGRPTEYLFHTDPGLLSPVAAYRLSAKGFELEDVQAMISTSDLYLKNNIMSRILGKSPKKGKSHHSSRRHVRLDSRQSALALLYARILESAIGVFGTHILAEEWLGRPCRYFEGEVPLDIIDNAVGFQIVQDYLTRIEYGLYH